MDVLNIFKKLWLQVKHLFNNMPVKIQQAAKISVTITEALKNFDDSYPLVADVITTIIPGDGDDKVVAWLRAQLPVILVKLKLITGKKATANPDKIVLNAVKNLETLEGDSKSAFLHAIAVMVAQEAAEAKGEILSWTNGVCMVEWYYKNKFVPKTYA